MDNDLSALIGQELVGFRLTHALGEGGMAAVFRGESLLNASIKRAIKVVRPELASREEFKSRFAEEASILETLRHRNVVSFYGVRSEGGFLVMELELLQGRTLSQLLTEGCHAPQAIEDAVGWIHQAAEGVAAAHERGIVHRDLKPDNLFLTEDGTVKVLDFGIARAVDEADRVSKLTVSGTIPGSPPYMAPEACSGDVPTASADVYALGITLLELLAGRHPFLPEGTTKSSTQMMFAHVHQDIPPLRSIRPEASELLERVLLRAVAKDPKSRFPSGRELADALRPLSRYTGRDTKGQVGVPAVRTEFALPEFQASTAATTPKAPAQAPTGKRALWLGFGLVVVVGGAVAGYAAVHREPRAVSDPVSVTDAGIATAAPVAEDLWVRVDPAPARRAGNRDEPVLLGLSSEQAPEEVTGFRPSRRIRAPDAPYELQRREVTWAEMDAFIERHVEHRFVPPDWVPAAPDRNQLPATGVPWEVALAYCRSLGGSLPTEEQWEYAARGSERRPYAWGSQPVDLLRTQVYRGPGAIVTAVMTSDQDRTPGREADSFYDMMGNAREWTADLFREDFPDQDESWTQQDGVSFRAVRGLPVGATPPPRLPSEGAAHREALCATGACPADTATVRQYVGLRCARHARSEDPERR